MPDARHPSRENGEGAFPRAWRDAGRAVESARFLLSAVVFDAVAAVGAYVVANDPDTDTRIKAVAVGGAVIVGPFFLAFTALLVLWVTAPVRQRNEARIALASLQKAPQLEATFEVKESDNLMARTMLEVTILNTGSEHVDDALLTLTVPRELDEFQPSDPYGSPILKGDVSPHPEYYLWSFDGVKLRANVATKYWFAVDGDWMVTGPCRLAVIHPSFTGGHWSAAAEFSLSKGELEPRTEKHA